MPFKQYTHCTNTADFDPLNRPLVKVGGIAAFVALILGVILGGTLGPLLIFGGAAAGYAVIVAVFEYLLGGKLICLGGDEFASGQVIGMEPASGKPFPDNFDNDLSINICLCPYKADINAIIARGNFEAVDLPDLATPPNFQDKLVKEQTASSNHGIPYSGYDEADKSFLKKPNFHIELEGSRIADMYAAFLAIWTLLTIASTIASALPWPFNLLALLLAALLGLGIAAATWEAADDGSLDDLDFTDGDLKKGDFIVSFGTWTYDSGHNDTGVGWNELHPVKFMSKAERCPNPKEAETWKDLIKESLDLAASGASAEPGWKIHPDIDECHKQDNNEPIK
jgi:hypothetical protein